FEPLPGVAAVSGLPNRAAERRVEIPPMARIRGNRRDGGSAWRVERPHVGAAEAGEIRAARARLKTVGGEIRGGGSAGNVVVALPVDGEAREAVLVVATETDQLHRWAGAGG